VHFTPLRIRNSKKPIQNSCRYGNKSWREGRFARNNDRLIGTNFTEVEHSYSDGRDNYSAKKSDILIGTKFEVKKIKIYPIA
jgi:hypothetical protein